MVKSVMGHYGVLPVNHEICATINVSANGVMRFSAVMTLVFVATKGRSSIAVAMLKGKISITKLCAGTVQALHLLLPVMR